MSPKMMAMVLVTPERNAPAIPSPMYPTSLAFSRINALVGLDILGLSFNALDIVFTENPVEMAMSFNRTLLFNLSNFPSF